jgi:hypothetical protein
MPIFDRSERETGDRGEDLPKSNPDTPPDSSDPSGRCPRCGRVSNFEPLGDLPLTSGGHVLQRPDGTTERDVLDRVSAFRCRGCNQAVAVVEEQWIGDHPGREGIGGGGTVHYQGIHWWPPPGSADLDASIPPTIREAYSEGLRALASRAPRAAAVMFRRSLEAIVEDRGGTSAKQALNKNLAAALREMVTEGTLDANLADWAAEIRIVGNVGAHFDPLKTVTDEEADSLAKLLRALLEYLYELPARIQRSRPPATPGAS